jgi:predicted metal-dependent HD superfamily phosphohydrolase
VSTDRVSLEAWAGLWSRLGAGSDPRPLHQEIRRAYGEPHRYYHTLEHVRRVLGLFDHIRERLARPDEAELALWLHDVIYHPRGRDNEERSAAYAEDLLHAAGVGSEVGDRVASLILATRHVAPDRTEGEPTDPRDRAYVLDVDLSILGAPADEFDHYEAQVRREYGYRSDEEWRQGRARVLRMFADRPRIFLTPEFDHLESPARGNLARSLRRLTAGPSRVGAG